MNVLPLTGASRQLERQINSFYYERLLSSRNKGLVKAEIKKLEPGLTPQDIIKDPYVLAFLGLKESKAYLENELEQGLIDKLHDFLLELGKGFSIRRPSEENNHASTATISTSILFSITTF